MLKINTRRYEIEEEIALTDENDNVIYKFAMQLSADDLKALQKALLGKDTLKMAKKIQNLEKSEMSDEEIDKVLEMSEEMDGKAIELIKELCFKEHKEKFIELGGEAKFEEMIGVISDYLLGFFIRKQTSRVNTINSDLAKISNN